MATEQSKIAKRMRALISSADAEDPVKADAEQEVLSFLKEKLAKNPKLLEAAREGKSLSVELTGDVAEELNKEDLNRVFARALRELKESDSDA